MITKLLSRWVLAHDGADHRLVEQGEVRVEADRVLSVGPRSDAPADRVENLGAALLAPGFVDLNALADVDTTILGFGGGGDRRDRMWSRAYAEAGAAEALTRAERVASARLAFAQLLLSGVTTALPVTSLLFRTWAEDADEFAEIAGLSNDLGLRLILGPSFRSAVNVVEADGSVGQLERPGHGAAGLRDAVRFVERCGEIGPLVSGLLVPSTIETCSDPLLTETAAAARSLGVPFRLHCCQSKVEAELVWRATGLTSLGRLRALGVLDDHALLPHAVVLGGPGEDPKLAAEDREILASSGATIVHCPLVLGRGGRRLESFAEYRRRGVRIGLGTDTAPPDMLMNLQMGLAMARTLDGDATRPADLFRAATSDAADAARRPDLGRLAPGRPADLAAWDLSDLAAQPVHDPVEALFLAPPGRRARHVWVAGRRVVADGAIPGLDAAAAAAAFAPIFEKLRARFARMNRSGLDWRALFPPAFPPATETPAPARP